MRASWLGFGLTALALMGCNGSTGEDTGEGDDYPTGCIATSEGRSFALLADAVAASPDGTTITLCPGAAQESVTVAGKRLTIEGSGQSTWEAPVNEPALVLSEGAEVTLTDVTVLTTRNGVELADSALTVSGVEFDTPGNYAVEGTESTVTLTDVAVTNPGWGAVNLSGASASLDATRLEVNGSTGNAVTLAEGASGSIAESTITTSLCTNDGTNCLEQDGWAVEITDGGSLALSGNTFTDNLIGGVRAESADVTSTGDVLSGNFIGFWLENSVASLDTVEVSDTIQYGILGLTLDLDLTDVSLSADPSLSSYEVNDDDTDGDGIPDANAALDGTYGLVGFDATVTGDGVSVSGHNGGGIYLTTRLDTSVAMDLANSVIDDNAGWGIFALLGDIGLTAVDVTNTRRNEDFCLQGATLYCDGAVWAAASDVTWDGGSLTGNDYIGFIGIQNNHLLSNLTIADNAETGVRVDAGALTLSNSAVSGTGAYATTISGGGVAVLDTVTFTDRSHVNIYEYSDGTILESHLAAYELLVVDSTATVRNSTFTNGERGLQSSGSSASLTVEDSSFSGYNRYGVYTSSGTASIARTTFEDVGGYAWFCINGSLSAQSSSLTRVPAYRSLSIEEAPDGTVTTSDYSFGAAGIYTSGCSVDLSNVAITDAEERGLYASNSSVQLDRFALAGSGNLSSSGYGAVQLNYSSTDPDALLNDVSITGVTTGDGLRVSGSSSLTAGSVRATELSIGADDGLGHAGIAGAGVRGLYIPDLRLTGLDVAGTAESGLVFSESAVQIDGTALLAPGTITGAGAHGIDLSGGSATVANLTIASPVQDGVHAVGSTLATSALTVTDAGGSGLYLDAGGGHSLTDTTVSGALDYGMTCVTDPQFATCDTLSVAGANGAHSGCDACATLAGF